MPLNIHIINKKGFGKPRPFFVVENFADFICFFDIMYILLRC